MTLRSSLAALALGLAIAPAVADAAPGDPDPAFGDGGRAFLAGTADYSPTDMVVQADGKAVITAGNNIGGPAKDIDIYRVDTDGRPDGGFGGDGKVSLDFGHADFSLWVDEAPDGKLVVSGVADNGDYVVTRLTEKGTVDTTFNPNGPEPGTKRVPFPNQVRPHLTDTVVQDDGRIVLTFSRQTGTFRWEGFGLRLLANGEIDQAAFPNIGAANADNSISDAANGPDGTIVVSGRPQVNFFNQSHIARYTGSGALDTSFGGDGKIETPEIADTQAMATRPDGRVLLAGFPKNVPGTPAAELDRVGVAQFTKTGELDKSFGQNGLAVAKYDGTEFVADVDVQPDGKVLVTSSVGQPGERQVAVARFNANGTPDASYGAGGKRVLPFAAAQLNETGVDAQGRHLTTGVFADGQSSRIFVTRTSETQAVAQPAPAPVAPAPEAPAPTRQELTLPPPADRTAPAITGLMRTGPASRAAVRFTLSEDARVAITITRPRRGRIRSLQRTFAVDARRGPNRIMNATVRNLPEGAYRLVARATDAAGNTSTEVARSRVARRR